MAYKERYLQAISVLPKDIQKILINFQDNSTIQEIRLRREQPISVTTYKGCFFVSNNGILSTSISNSDLICTLSHLEMTFRNLCDDSIYTHQSEIINGYITLQGGHRAGICGTAIYEKERIQSVRDISSINLRIAGQIPKVSLPMIQALGNDISKGVLIAGAPCSGKTTLLRDLTKQLSYSTFGSKKIAVIDERGEIGACFHGKAQNDLGPNTDVLNGYKKADGIEHAVRCMSPDIIICDEIGKIEEVSQMIDGFNSGVQFIATVHAGTKKELLKRRQIQMLINTGIFSNIVLLSGRNQPGEINEIYKAGEYIDETSGISFADSSNNLYGV